MRIVAMLLTPLPFAALADSSSKSFESVVIVLSVLVLAAVIVWMYRRDIGDYLEERNSAYEECGRNGVLGIVTGVAVILWVLLLLWKWRSAGGHAFFQTTSEYLAAVVNKTLRMTGMG